MSGRKAKTIRRAIYGDLSLQSPRRYVRHGITLVNAPRLPQGALSAGQAEDTSHPIQQIFRSSLTPLPAWHIFICYVAVFCHMSTRQGETHARAQGPICQEIYDVSLAV